MKIAIRKRKTGNTRKPKKRNQSTLALLESMAELKGYVDKGWTIDDIARHYRRHHPERIRTVTIPVPGKYSPAAIKKLRASLGMSQAIFAQWIGVSAILVQSWERGVRTPSPLARRLLDTISVNPDAWIASFRRAG